jgi:hypothetical protein
MTMSKPSTGAKHRLLVSTAMLGVLCLGYGRRAYAACSGAGGTYNCTPEFWGEVQPPGH